MNTIRRPIVMSPTEQIKLLRTVDRFRVQTIQWHTRAILWKLGCIVMSLMFLVSLVHLRLNQTHILKLSSQVCALKAVEP